MIGVLLPDTTTSTRYVQYDAPNLKKAFETAGLSSSQFKIDNAHGSAEHDAAAGRGGHHRRRLGAPRSIRSTSGPARPSSRTPSRKGVKVIDYDRLVTGGPQDRYYVSFNNVEVGQADRPGRGRLHRRLEGQQADSPGDETATATDNNAKLFAQGLQRRARPEVRRRHVHEGRRAGRHVGCPTAATTFEQQFTAHPNMNAVVMPNDDTANAVISRALEEQDPGEHVPDHRSGRRHRSGLQNILKGYQCGTVYKPYFAEAQAAAALALYLQGRQDAAVLARERRRRRTRR